MLKISVYLFYTKVVCSTIYIYIYSALFTKKFCLLLNKKPLNFRINYFNINDILRNIFRFNTIVVQFRNINKTSHLNRVMSKVVVTQGPRTTIIA